jgi:hypothetical protein
MAGGAFFARGVPLLLGAGPAGFYGGGYAAAGAELAADDGPDRLGGLDYVFEYLIDDVFLEDAEVAVAVEILLERLELMESEPKSGRPVLGQTEVSSGSSMVIS